MLFFLDNTESKTVYEALQVTPASSESFSILCTLLFIAFESLFDLTRSVPNLPFQSKDTLFSLSCLFFGLNVVYSEAIYLSKPKGEIDTMTEDSSLSLSKQ